MTKKKDEAGLEALRDAVEEGDSRASPLYRWMWLNHDEFAEMLKGRRPNWSRLTETFAGLGYTDMNGDPLHPETVRKMWWRVRRQYAEQTARRLSRGKPLLQGPVSIIREEISRSEPIHPEPARPDPVIHSGIKPVKLSRLAGPSSSAPADTREDREQEVQHSDPDETIRKLREQITGRGGVPTPLKRSD